MIRNAGLYKMAGRDHKTCLNMILVLVRSFGRETNLSYPSQPAFINFRYENGTCYNKLMRYIFNERMLLC